MPGRRAGSSIRGRDARTEPLHPPLAPQRQPRPQEAAEAEVGPPQEVAEEAGEPLPLEGAEEAEHHQEVAEAAESLRLEGAVEAEPRREAVVEA